MKLLANLLVFGCLALGVAGFVLLCTCVWGYQHYGWMGIVIPAVAALVALWLAKIALRQSIRWMVMRLAQGKGAALKGATLTVTDITRSRPTESGAPVFLVGFTIAPEESERFYDPSELLIVPEASVISFADDQPDDTIGHLEQIDVRVDGAWVRDFEKLKGVHAFRARLVITGPAPQVPKPLNRTATDDQPAPTVAPFVVPARVKVQNWFSYIGVIALPTETVDADRVD